MYSTKILLSIAALAGTSLSQKSDSQFCSSYASSLFSLFGEAPTTPPAILSFLAQSTQPASPTTTASPATTPPPAETPDFIGHAEFLCELLTELPPSLLPDFQSFAGELLSFGKVHSSEYVAYATDCAPADEAASSASYLSYIFTATGNLCQPTPTPSGASNGTYPTTPAPTATSSHAGTSATSVVTAAAGRPTGAFLGAAAIGGILGAAAML
ncbi:hypothetical protein F4859DRAFT_486424 [Xylaria cf. heliscus]|nr:hypothetical protein F4859DRAFT_486424 [Xylaria cf. heliscus]